MSTCQRNQGLDPKNICILWGLWLHANVYHPGESCHCRVVRDGGSIAARQLYIKPFITRSWRKNNGEVCSTTTKAHWELFL